eukprot:TRINITY_DN44356_c0_g1_i1.p1 TRINITY_DN44356_c0_g1~~TRINITY_DN44356_c0_g1_i1.p1  ORF type:complete len:485 (+),score=140.43 TRINITY_DN44356_c0_g1_i1:43-1455(+)
MTVLEQHGAYVIRNDEAEDCRRSVHVLVISTYDDSPKPPGRTGHPYLSSMPAKLQKHFNPRKMDRDRYEEPYNTRAEEWFSEETAATPPHLIDSTMLPACGVCYVLPVTIAAGRKDYEGLAILGKKFYRKVASFLMDLDKKEVRLSFLGVGIGGLVARASLAMFRRQGSALDLSSINVVLESFVTLDTPHMGVRRPPELGNVYKWLRHRWVMSSYGMVGRELLLEDADFVLMELALHDSETGECMECFERVAFVCTQHSMFCTASSGLMHTHPSITPLGEYVHLCRRTGRELEDDLVVLTKVPEVEVCGSRAAGAPFAMAAELRYLLLESMWGLPMVFACALLIVSFQDDYLQPTVMGVDVLVITQLVLSLLFLLTLGTAGYAFSAGINEPPETKYAHLSDPHALSSYYKICTRVYKTSPTDHHSELCVNIVKEVLNTRYYHSARRCLLPPYTSKREALRRAANMLELRE